MRFIWITLILLLVGCSTPSSQYTLETVSIATPTPITLPDTIAANSSITIALAAAGAPEAAPTMELHIKVFDDLTGQPMTARVAWLVTDELRAVGPGDLQWTAEGVDLLLPGEVSGWLVISAPGYETWTLQVRYRILTSRELEMPVRMRRGGASL